MHFSNNFISGPILYCFANYTQLTLLNSSDNNFSGSIPPKLACSLVLCLPNSVSPVFLNILP
uniref:Putative leucine-rich repeat domain, L domain-like protein n=1 Tax=Helianthus annuus TaxID=4232 RepID=A0A251TKA3_HELAN